MAFDIDFTVCIVVMAVLTAVYVIAGGYFATAVNDFIQGIIMIGGIIAVDTFSLLQSHHACHGRPTAFPSKAKSSFAYTSERR